MPAMNKLFTDLLRISQQIRRVPGIYVWPTTHSNVPIERGRTIRTERGHAPHHGPVLFHEDVSPGAIDLFLDQTAAQPAEALAQLLREKSWAARKAAKRAFFVLL
jgi:hypothetical protein